MVSLRLLVVRMPLALAFTCAAACGGKEEDAGGGSGSDDTETGTSDDGPATTGGTGSGPSTSSGTTATNSDPGSSSADDGSFIDEPDGGLVGMCDPGVQDCPNPDEKCTPYAMTPGTCCVDSTKCVPIIGEKQAGDQCTRTADNDDCGKGLFCTTQTSGSTGEGFCEQLCVIGDPASCDFGTCIVYNDGVLPLCRIECDPLVQDCTGGFGCYPAQETFVCGKPANEPGSGNDGDECYTTRSCLPGLACVTADVLAGCGAQSRCCTPFCDVTGADPCTDPSEDCVPWFVAGMAPPGHDDVGACLIPQ